MTSVCFPAHQSPSEKGSALKGANLLPRGEKSPFRVDFSEGKKNNSDRITSL